MEQFISRYRDIDMAEGSAGEDYNPFTDDGKFCFFKLMLGNTA